MIQTIYLIILTYFLLGGLGFYIINRKKTPKVARESYTKFIAYFFIIHILFFGITVNPAIFRILAILISGVGLFELFQLFRRNNYKPIGFFAGSIIVFTLLSTGFIFFSKLQKEFILFSFLVLSIFDSFSQITGQLWGRKKLVPKISPNKTVGGLVGGTLVALASSQLLHSLFPGTALKALLVATGIVLFAFAGDLAASFYKRKFNVKNYSHLIPGHGGFLDRFDSLIAGGAWVALSTYLLSL